jgi:hypothetical protein
MSALFPELRTDLIAAGRRRRVARRRRITLAVIATMLLGAGAALAASGLLGKVDQGRAGKTSYSITAVSRGKLLCLRVVWSKQRPAVRCDPSPTGRQPFGPVMRTVAPNGDAQLLAGLVRSDVARVRLLDTGRVIDTAARPGVPGRVFSLQGKFRRVALEALGANSSSLGELGTHSATTAPNNREAAKAQGDPAAFAPARSMPPLRFRGRLISDREATRRHLSCSSDTGRCTTRAEFMRELRKHDPAFMRELRKHRRGRK